MSWLAVLLVGVGVTDLVHSARPVRHLPQVVGAVVALVLGLLAGLTSPLDVVALVLVAGAVLLWGYAVTLGFGRGRPWLPLLVLGAALAVAVAASPAAGEADGVVGEWLARGPLPLLAGLDADRLLLLLGAVLVQMSTGNVVVRLVLAVTGTLDRVGDGPRGPETRLKGGRLLGPMERLFILGLGLAGQLTAAAIVVAAKGLLRFPELQSKSEQQRIHQLTEYFLVGSFASWLVALASLALVAG
jgi:hypothetical protein